MPMKHISDVLKDIQFKQYKLPSGAVFAQFIEPKQLSNHNNTTMGRVKDFFIDQINDEYDRKTASGFFDECLPVPPHINHPDYPHYKFCIDRIQNAFSIDDKEFTVAIAEETLHRNWNYQYSDIYHLNPEYFDYMQNLEANLDDRPNDEPYKTTENPNG